MSKLPMLFVCFMLLCSPLDFEGGLASQTPIGEVAVWWKHSPGVSVALNTLRPLPGVGFAVTRKGEFIFEVHP